MPTCRELTELVTDYLERRLPQRQQEDLRMHLECCGSCREYLAQMQATVRVLANLPRARAPEAMRRQLLAEFRRARATRPTRSRSRLAAAMSHSASAAIIVLIALVLALAKGSEPGTGLGPWAECLALELGAGLAVVLGIGLVATRAGRPLAAGRLAAIAAGGALLAFLALQLSCPLGRFTSHLLVIHVGGVVLAAVAGAVAGRLPPLRTAS